jgi:hypothetical protein
MGLGEDYRMSSPTERLNAVEPRVDALEKALGVKPLPPLRSRIYQFLSRHKAAIGIMVGFVAILVAIAVVYLPRASDQKKQDLNDVIDRRIDSSLKAPGGVLEKLQQLQITTAALSAKLTTLEPFIQDVIRRQFDIVSKLAPQALGEKLPALTHLIQAADVQGIRVQPQLSVDLSKNLLRVSSASAGYWMAASQLVSYRSVPTNKTSPGSAPCTKLNVNIDRETGPAPEDIDTHIEASDCTFDLGDNPNFRGGGFPQATYLILHNVRVRYNGGSIRDLPQTVVFDHCIFEFKINDRPPAPAQRLTNALLAAVDLSNLSYNPE